MSDDLTRCDVCGCPAQLRSYFDERGRRLRYCNYHEDHGTDLPCPDCALAEDRFPMTPPPLLDDAAAYRAHRDDAETLAHLDLLQRRKTRIGYQLHAAREQVSDLERALQTAGDDLALALAAYKRAAARPLIET